MQANGDYHLRASPDKPLANLLPPLSALCSGDRFVRCSADGKDTTLVSVKLDTHGRSLRISSKEGESSIEVRKLRVSFLHALERAPPVFASGDDLITVLLFTACS